MYKYDIKSFITFITFLFKMNEINWDFILSNTRVVSLYIASIVKK